MRCTKKGGKIYHETEKAGCNPILSWTDERHRRDSGKAHQRRDTAQRNTEQQRSPERSYRGTANAAGGGYHERGIVEPY